MKTYIVTEQDIERLKNILVVEDFKIDKWKETLKTRSTLDFKSMEQRLDEIFENTTNEDILNWLNSK